MTTSPIGYTASAKEYLQYLFANVLDVDPLVADWAYNRLLADALTADEVMRELRYGTDSTPQGQAAHAMYVQRYPRMKEILQSGRLPWAPNSSPEQVYQEYENTVASLVKRYGADGSLVTRSRISDYIMADISATEVSDRLQLASDAVNQMPDDVRRLFKTYYGIDQQDLVSFYLDPKEMAPVLQRKSQAVRLAGEGLMRGVQIERAKAEWLAMNNVTPSEAGQAFAGVAARFGLEYGMGVEKVSRDRMVDAAFGSEQAIRDVERVQGSRKADFQQGGGYEETAKGITALGSAND